jgi:serine/threonine-protein kinase
VREGTVSPPPEKEPEERSAEKAAPTICAPQAHGALPDPGGSERRTGSLVGRVVNGKYEVLSLLGEGGMGVVYKVRHLLLPNKNLFALKVLHSRFSADAEFRARFLREVEVTMDLTHENIVQIRDFGMTEEQHLFFTMDHFPGRSLKTLIEKKAPLPSRRVIGIAREILLALREAHRGGVIHRDLKPDNVLVEEEPGGRDRVRVLDFGIAKLLETDGKNDLTRDNLIGTPKYMSPEQAGGDSLDGRSDLYSLGIMIYEMLTGQVPFRGGTTRSILMGHLTSPPPPFAEARPELAVPAPFERLVFDLLAKDPSARPASAEAVIERLHAESTARSRVGAPRRRLLPVGRLVLGAVILAAAGLALEHYLPWRTFTTRQAEAEAAPPPAAEDELAPAPRARPTEPAPEGAQEALGSAPAPQPAPLRASAARLSCEVCGKRYRPGERLENMCHGIPLLELQGE